MSQMNTKKSVSIIGCGWFGKPLAVRLASADYTVKGSTTKEKKIEELKFHGIQAYLYRISDEFPEELVSSEFVVFNVPPGRNNQSQLKHYLPAVKDLISTLKEKDSLKKLLFISSTGVYGNEQDIYSEASICEPRSASGEVLLASELEIVNSGLPHNILRFGGLAGPGRHPGRFLAGKANLVGGDQAVNFLHLDDAIGVSCYLLENDITNEVFNVVSPVHPQKKDFYSKMADNIGVERPLFTETPSSCRREIDVSKLLNLTKYQFIYPDPMKFKFE